MAQKKEMQETIIEEEIIESVGDDSIDQTELEKLRQELLEARKERERLKEIIKEEGRTASKRKGKSPYDVPQTGEVREIELIQKRIDAIKEEDIDEIRSIDKEIDAIRGQVLGVDVTKKKPRIVPLGQRDPLNFDKRPGYMRRIFNDRDDGRRFAQAMAAGWRPVVDPNLKTDGDFDIHRPTQMGSIQMRHVGNGVQGALFEIPEEIYNRVKNEQYRKNNEAVRAQLRGQKKQVSSETGDASAIYGEIEIKMPDELKE